MSPPQAGTIQETYGALLIGSLVAMTVYGITTLQTYFYFLTFPKDGFLTRTLVSLVWIVDTLHVIFMCHSVYSYVISNYGNPKVIAYGNWPLFMSVGANILMMCLVQSFFTYRIFKLCQPQRRWWVGGYIGCLVAVHCVLGVVIFIFLQDYLFSYAHLHTVVVPLAVFNVVSDVSVAAALCALLWGNRSGFNDTDTAINKLIIFLINRCILTSAVAVTESVVFIALPNTLYAFAIDFTLGKLYANSLLAVLNSRAQLRQKPEEFKSTEMSTRFVVASRVGDHRMHVEVQTPESLKGASIIREESKDKEWP